MLRAVTRPIVRLLVLLASAPLATANAHEAGRATAAPAHPRAMKTLHSQRRTTFSATLPRRSRFMPVRP